MLGKLAFTNKIVAKNLGMPEERVAKVMTFFAENLNKELLSCEHTFVYVMGLGTFTMVLRPIENKIRRMYRHYQNTKVGKGIRNSEESLLDLRRVLFELFALRRKLKGTRKELKILKDVAREASGNCKG